MVYSSIPVTPSKAKKADTSIITEYNNEKTSHESELLCHPPSLFSDKYGNLKLVNVVVRNPCLVFVIILVICIGITVDLSRTAFKNGNPFTSDSNTYDIYDKRSLAYDGLRFAKQEVAARRKDLSTIESNKNSNDVIRQQERLGDVTYWIYEAKTEKGLFTKDSLPVMRSAEVMFTRQKQYPEYCWLRYSDVGNETTAKCERELSVLNAFYASSWNSTTAQDIMSELTLDNVKLYNSVAACVEFNILCQYIISRVKQADINWAKGMNQRINGMIRYWDGEGELNGNPDQVSLLLAHIKQLDTKAPYVNFFVDGNFTIDNPNTMFSRSIVYWGSPLANSDDSSRVSRYSSTNLLKGFIIKTFLEKLKDLSSEKHSDHIRTYYFMGTLIFDVIIDILLSDAMKALLSFLLVFVYLRTMIGSWLLASVGMIEIFLSLPLAWYFFSNVLGVQYFSTLNVLTLFIVAAIGADDIFVFMDAYKQSAQKKELLRSMETRMSWVYRRSGNAMMITSATTCFAFLCTVISPIASTRSFGIFAALVIMFDYILVMTLFCTSVVIYHDRLENELGLCSCFCCVKNDPSPTEQALSKFQKKEGPVEDRISYFFREKFASFILKPKLRLLVFIPMIAWIVLACWYTSKLQPTRTAEQALSEDHPLQKGVTILNEKFPKVQQDRGTFVNFIWGLHGADREGVRQLYDPDFIGSPKFVDQFSFTDECQEKVLRTCDALRTEDRFEDLIKKNGQGLRNVQCFLEELGAHNVLGDLKDCDKVKNGAWRNQTWYFNDSSDTKSFTEQNSCYGDKPVQDFYEDSFGWDGKSLKFVGITVESSILDPYSTLPEERVREHYEEFMQYAQEFNSEMEGACEGKVLITDLDQKFVFMNNQRIYRTSAVSGSMVGVLIAFIVLLLSTRKLHIAFFATISIFSVLVSVIGSTTMMGWTLGTNEAILISILAGFSVDYVVHLAHAYVHAVGNTEERLRDAFGNMGISVFSGMLTSVVASIPLFTCTLVFFAKFGTFLCFTILFSWIFANFGFMSLIAQANIRMEHKNR